MTLSLIVVNIPVAFAHPNYDWDWSTQKRTLLYRYAVDVPAQWQTWFDSAISNWNTGLGTVGSPWTLGKSLTGPDYDVFVKVTDISPGGVCGQSHACTIWTSQDATSLGVLQRAIIIDSDPSEWANCADGTNWVWSTTNIAGMSTRDPIRVAMHEISHTMRMTHGTHLPGSVIHYPTSCNDHNVTPAADDLTNAQATAKLDWTKCTVPIAAVPDGLSDESGISCFSIGGGSGSVGGFGLPIDKLALLTPFIGLASVIVAVATVTAVYVRHVKHREEKQ